MDVPGRPLLENEVRRDDGADASAPVDDNVIVGDAGSSSKGDNVKPAFRLRSGISKGRKND